MVNTRGEPKQPLDSGITVMVAVTGKVVLLMAVKAGILPVPYAGNPIIGLLFVQL